MSTDDKGGVYRTHYERMKALDPVEREIDDLVRDHEHLTDIQLTGRLNHIQVMASARGRAQEALATYKSAAKKMTPKELRGEEHDSKRLGKHLIASGCPKPPGNVDAHAIIAGDHGDATRLRARLKLLKIRIDDPDNGMWMPSRTADTPHPWFPRCQPHSRIHRHYYYVWLNTQLGSISNEHVFRHTLNQVEIDLHNNEQPDWVMLPKGQAENID